jgi:hypothetical protein
MDCTGGAALIYPVVCLNRSKHQINMPQKRSVCPCDTGSLGYLVTTRKAVPILLAHKIRDVRLQRLLGKSAFLFLALVIVGICGFFVMPTFWSVGIFVQGICFFALVLWLGADDLFLQFALEDERFFEMATSRSALSVFRDDEQSLPQPGH